jgi:hypothetical protein
MSNVHSNGFLSWDSTLLGEMTSNYRRTCHTSVFTFVFCLGDEDGILCADRCII